MCHSSYLPPRATISLVCIVACYRSVSDSRLLRVNTSLDASSAQMSLRQSVSSPTLRDAVKGIPRKILHSQVILVLRDCFCQPRADWAVYPNPLNASRRRRSAPM